MGHFPFGVDGAGWDQHQIGDQAEVLSVGVGARSRVDHDEIDAARFLGLEERQKPFNTFRWREDRETFRPLGLLRTLPRGQFETVAPAAELGIHVAIDQGDATPEVQCCRCEKHGGRGLARAALGLHDGNDLHEMTPPQTVLDTLAPTPGALS